MELRSGVAVIDRADGSVQVGGDLDNHVRLTGLTAGQRRWLHRLGERSANRALGYSVAPSPRTPRGGDPLVDVLTGAGLVLDSPPRPVMPAIGVDGIDAVVLTALVLLAQCGDVVVDVTTTGRTDSEMARMTGERTLGMPSRRVALERLAREPRVHVTRLSRPDVVIVSRRRALDLAACSTRVAQDQPHLLVLHEEQYTHVGPYVVPGITPCATCWALERTAQDHCRPRMDEDLRDVPLAPRSSLLVSAAAVVIARTVLAGAGMSEAAVSPFMPRRHGHYPLVSVDGAGREVERDLRASSECGCGASGVPFRALPPLEVSREHHEDGEWEA